VGNKEVYDFSNVLGIRTKFRAAKGTFVITRESPITVLGCDEVYIFPHAQSLRRTLIHRWTNAEDAPSLVPEIHLPAGRDSGVTGPGRHIWLRSLASALEVQLDPGPHPGVQICREFWSKRPLTPETPGHARPGNLVYEWPRRRKRQAEAEDYSIARKGWLQARNLCCLNTGRRQSAPLA
jgi:hypothetical protein